MVENENEKKKNRPQKYIEVKAITLTVVGESGRILARIKIERAFLFLIIYTYFAMKFFFSNFFFFISFILF